MLLVTLMGALLAVLLLLIGWLLAGWLTMPLPRCCDLVFHLNEDNVDQLEQAARGYQILRGADALQGRFIIEIHGDDDRLKAMACALSAQMGGIVIHKTEEGGLCDGTGTGTAAGNGLCCCVSE